MADGAARPHAPLGGHEMSQQGTSPSEARRACRPRSPRVEQALTRAELQRKIPYTEIFDTMSPTGPDGARFTRTTADPFGETPIEWEPAWRPALRP
jgi:hypothetical protein